MFFAKTQCLHQATAVLQIMEKHVLQIVYFFQIKKCPAKYPSPSFSVACMGKAHDPHCPCWPSTLAQIRPVVHLPPSLQGAGGSTPPRCQWNEILDPPENQQKYMVKSQDGPFPHTRPPGVGICRTTFPTSSPARATIQDPSIPQCPVAILVSSG